MANFLKNRKFFNILLLICSIVFLILPKISLAETFEEISPEEIKKYLELPEKDTKDILSKLNQAFTSERIHRESSLSGDQLEILTLITLHKVVDIDVLNYLFVDAPIEIIWKITKETVDIAQIILAKDIKKFLEKLEKESVREAIEYGKNYLLQNEIRVSSGAIKYKYTSQKEEEKEVTIQYILVYQPLGQKRGNVVIRYYSPHPIAPPKSKQPVKNVIDRIANFQSIYNLQYYIEPFPHDIPPFIIEIFGKVEKDEWENYYWIDEQGRRFVDEKDSPLPEPVRPIIKITFPPEVPDLGIRPLSFWERQILKPIKTTIKEVEVIITKVTGKSPEIAEKIFNIPKTAVDVWNKIKSTIGKLKLFPPAALVPEGPGPKEQPLTVKETEKRIQEFKEGPEEQKEETREKEKPEVGQEIGQKVPTPGVGKAKTREERLAEIQKKLDDISVQINVLNQRLSKLVQEKEKKEKGEEKEIVKKERETCLPNSININTASATELEKIIGVGPVLAQRIIEARPFSSLNDLIKVKGIGEATLQKIIGQGCAYVEPFCFAGGGGGSASSSPTPEPTICSQENLSQPIHQPIIFNEIAWMGSASSSADEWIELKNVSTSSVLLSGWQLIGINTKNNETKIKVFFNNQHQVLESGYFLLERSDDDSVPGISADKIFTGAINDSEFVLRLFDSQCNLIDEIQATSSWPGGQTTPERKTMERDENLNWYTSFATSSINGLFGTPKAENSQPPSNQLPIASFTFTPENPIVDQEIIFDASSSTDDGTITNYLWDFGDATSTTTTLATTTHIYSTSGSFTITLLVVDNLGATSSPATTTITVGPPPTLSVVINEIAWMGTKAESNDEWIELYNNTDSPIDLAGWKILKNGEDFITISTSTAATTTIPAKGFYLLERKHNQEKPDDTIKDILADLIFTGGLSNSGDVLTLLDFQGNLVDKVDCQRNEEGKCIGWFAGKNKNLGTSENPNWLRVSMERISATSSGAISTNWASNNLITRNGKDAAGNRINGTPKAKNSVSTSPTTITSLPFNEFSEITLTYFGSPYIIQTSLLIPTSTILKIEPGVILKFNSSLEIRGKLEAIGESDKKIVFTSIKDDEFGGDTNNDGTSTQPTPGDWDWLYFNQSLGSKLKNVIFRYGGKLQEGSSSPRFTRGMVQVENGEITIEDSKFEKAQTVSLWLKNSSSTIEKGEFAEMNYFSEAELNIPDGINNDSIAIFVEGGTSQIRNSIFATNTVAIALYKNASSRIEENSFSKNSIPVYLHDSSISFKNNLFENNNLNAILVEGYIENDVNWESDTPFVIGGLSIGSPGILTLKPGVIIKFKNEKSVINIQGKIFAQGTLEQKIIFTSFKDDIGGDTNQDGNLTQATSGDWSALRFYNSTSTLDNVIIRYGGATPLPFTIIRFGAITLKANVDIEIKNSIIEKNKYALAFIDENDYQFTNCEVIKNRIEVLKSQNNIFQENNYNAYPESCF